MEEDPRTIVPTWGKGLWGDAGFWEQAWQQERRYSLYGRQQPERSGPGWWDRRAARFAASTGSEDGRRRVAEVLHMLGRQAALQPDAEVLDIGCGPGNYALPLARRVRKVVALDPSEGMLAILKQKAAAEGITNIETVCQPWEEVDLDRLGWRGRFDLVLAAMSPGIHDVPTLQKMLAASRHSCFFSGFSRREDPAQRELWRRLFQEEMPSFAADVLYVFHLLHAWGYYPSLELACRRSRREQDPIEAVDELEEAFAPFLEVTSQIRQEISRLVGEMSREGRFCQERVFVEGNLAWSVSIPRGQSIPT